MVRLYERIKEIAKQKKGRSSCIFCEFAFKVNLRIYRDPPFFYEGTQLKKFLLDHLSTIILGVLLIVISACSLFVGVLDITLTSVLTDGYIRTIFFASRLPRLLAILCTGIGMSIAGLIMQQLCMNKFISPTTGATISSAQLGILIATVFIPSASLWSRAAISFVFALLGTWIFVAFIQRVQFKDVVMVPLIGIMFGYVITGVTNFIAYKFDMTQQLSGWLTGNFSMILAGRYEIVYLVVPMVLLAFIFANYFNIVGMGRDFSANLGVNYNVVLFLGITISAMITASIVVIVGQISYIGLIIPNIVAMFKGDRLKGTLADTALSGALFVLVCDILARIIIKPYELPIELIVGIVGSIVFIITILYRMRYGNRSIKSIRPLTGRRLAKGGRNG